MTDLKPYVAIVDDDASVRRSLDSLLRSVGLDVHLYATAQEFMSAARPDVPGCLLPDPGQGRDLLLLVDFQRVAEIHIIPVFPHYAPVRTNR